MERKEKTESAAGAQMDKHERREAFRDDRREEFHDEHFCHCHGDCHKRLWAKVLGALIIFLAGMGFHALVQCGPCPTKTPRAFAGVPGRVMPNYSDGQGNVIIINTDGSHGMSSCGCNAGASCGCAMGDSCNGNHFANHDKDMNKDMRKFRKHQQRGGFVDAPAGQMPDHHMDKAPMSVSKGAAVK